MICDLEERRKERAEKKNEEEDCVLYIFGVSPNDSLAVVSRKSLSLSTRSMALSAQSKYTHQPDPGRIHTLYACVCVCAV